MRGSSSRRLEIPCRKEPKNSAVDSAPYEGLSISLHLFFAMSPKTLYLYVFVAFLEIPMNIHVVISMTGAWLDSENEYFATAKY